MGTILHSKSILSVSSAASQSDDFFNLLHLLLVPNLRLAEYRELRAGIAERAAVDIPVFQVVERGA